MGKIKHGVKLLADVCKLNIVPMVICTCIYLHMCAHTYNTHTHKQGSEWFKAKVDIEVSKASHKAIEAIERQEGRIITAHYNRLGLRVLLKPWKFQEGLVPRRALPNKKLMAYYLNPENRFGNHHMHADVSIQRKYDTIESNLVSFLYC